MTTEVLTFAELDAALESCMRAHPNAMSDLWAPMVLARRSAVPIADVDGRVIEAFRRWQAP